MIETDTSELRLNVTSFNKNQETQNLLLAEEGSLITNDCEHKFGGDHIYKIQDDVTTDDVLGVINWLHYPIGDVAFRHTNSFSTHKSSITNV
uniref:Uncharacterized protein n=1 Tax=Caenorhabditis japonica TaxID=281687 RepID=A0A8R1DYC4_CAEJA